jgi:hypothetical protein
MIDLSYRVLEEYRHGAFYHWLTMVPRGGFEPPTCPLGGDRAIHCATGAERGCYVLFWN